VEEKMKIIRTENQIKVETPYNPDLPAKARNLGGKWDGAGKAWIFDIRDEERVEDLYRNIYGEWDSEGKASADAVTVRVKILNELAEYNSGLFFGGRQIARATGRDSGAKLGCGVIVLEGGFSSGGSVKNWKTTAKEGTVFEIRDIPLCKVEEEKGNAYFEIEIIGDVDKAALQAEKERLLKRLAEIEDLLK